MFLPASHEKLSPASLVIAILVPLALSGISQLLTRRQIKPAYYPLAVVGLGLAGLGIFRVINPKVFNSMVETIGVLFPKGVSLTTIEMQPLFFPGGEFSLEVAWGSFTTALPLSFIALGILIYLIIKRDSSQKSLLVVWSLVILVATLGQRRFASYLAINAALLTGYLSIVIFFVIRFVIAYLRGEPAKKYLSYQILESPDIEKLVTKPTGTTPKMVKKKAKMKKRPEARFRISVQQVTIALGVIFILFFVVFFPNPRQLAITKQTGVPLGKAWWDSCLVGSAIDTAKQTPSLYAPSDAWCQSLSWLKANTPDPFGNPDYYYEFYEPSSPSRPAYTILAWWDYGYWITRIAHRVPNTNPAQGGVRDVALFFLSQDEDSANETRQKLGSTYIIIDYDTVTDKLWAIAAWAGREESEFYDIYYQPQEGELVPVRLFYPEYYRSLSARLYNFDGKAVTPQSSVVISYRKRVSREGEPYKEITDSKSFPSYEEAVAYVSSQKSANYKIVGTDPFLSPVPLEAVKHYQLVHSSESLEMPPGGGTVPSVKIFEYIE